MIEKEFIAQFDITFDQTKPIKNEEVGTPKNLLGFFLMENMPHCLGDFSNLLNILLEIKKMLGSSFFFFKKRIPKCMKLEGHSNIFLKMLPFLILKI